MTDSWINHGIYPLLERIGDFSIYYGKICTYLATICFLMTMMMAIIKIFLGITEAREQIIKMGVSLCMYFIMMFIYPIAMKAVLPFAMNLGYGAIFGTSSSVTESGSYEDLGKKGGSRGSFYKWMGEKTGNIFTTSKDQNQQANEVSVALNMNIVDAETGYIDLNKFMLYILAFLKIGFHALPKISLFHADLILILCAFLYFLAIIVAVVCMFVVIINYIMCLIDYFALLGFGILTIPLSLWDGTKSYTEKLYGSVGSIILKLVVISAFMCLSVMSVVDFFIEVYLAFLDVGLAFSINDSFKLVELSVTLVLKGFLLAVLTMQTEKIAGFLNGGSPQMSFIDAMKGGVQTGLMAAGAGKLAGSTVSARGNFLSGVGRTGGAGLMAKRLGGNAKDFASSMASTAGNSLARSSVNAISNAPQAIGGGLKAFAGMTGMRSGGDSVGMLGIPGLGRRSGGGSSGGGGYGGGGSTGGGSASSESGFMPDNINKEIETDDKGMVTGNLKAMDMSGRASPYGESEKNDKTWTDEKGREHQGDGSYTSFGDKLTGMAGSMSTGGYFSRKAAQYIGTAGSVIQEVKKASKARSEGNVMGNSTFNAVGRGLARGVRGGIAAEMNAGGGMQVRFNHSPELKKLYGDKLTARMNSSNSKREGSDGQIHQNPTDIINY